MTKKEQAKKIKIETLLPANTKFFRFKGKMKTTCPFHKDTANPNFFIYLVTNSWFCFAGCGGGDSIAFMMKLKNISFPEALDILTNK
jgi:DNA primase